MFRQSAVIAYELKRTLVMPYFHTQPTVRDLIPESEVEGGYGVHEDGEILKDPGQGNPYRLRVFDQTYRVRLVNNPKETIDEDALNSLRFKDSEKNMETLKPEQFKEVCPDGLDVIVKCGTVGAARYIKLKNSCSLA